MTSLEGQGRLQGNARPILKWAGGKTQLLPALRKHYPRTFGKYIEPFLGGGAVFFDLAPRFAVLSDANSELISLYRTIASDPDAVAEALHHMPVSEPDYYLVRAMPFNSLDSITAAARTIFLNKTCFNGLYRVNRSGDFNVPYGKRSSVKFPSHEVLRAASRQLAFASLIEGDYLEVLERHAAPGDFVFLDPPYLPVGRFADFKRYTPNQFSEADHYRLAAEFHRLVRHGVSVVLTNSNHPLVYELYKDFSIEVVDSKRHINSKGHGRTSQDVIVSAIASDA